MLTSYYNQMLMMMFTSIKPMMIYLSLILIITPLTMKNMHPTSMLIFLVLFTTTICMKMSMIHKNSWFSYLLFLSMIGGILILFLYFVSICSNEKSMLNQHELKMMLTLMFMVTSTLIMIIYFFDSFSIMGIENNFNSKNFMLTSKNWSNFNHYNSFQMYNSTYKTTIMCMIYLLFSLYTLMKMCMKYYGPLRQMN
nr:NADH dehydrogenase subunit 6 [Syrista sp. 1 GYN-2021c]